MQGPPFMIDRNRALTLARATDGRDFSAHLGQRCNQFPGSLDERAPPIFRRLLCAHLIDHV
jgi:hypothetical protein